MGEKFLSRVFENPIVKFLEIWYPNQNLLKI